MRFTSFPSIKRTSFVAMIAAIFVERNFHIGFNQRAFVGQFKLHIPDVESSFYPHTLVIGLDRQDFSRLVVDTRRVIKVFGAKQQVEFVGRNHVRGIGKKEIRIGFEVYHAIVFQETAIAFEEKSARKSLVYILHLRVAERQLQLLHLVGGEETVDNLDIGTQESHVGKPLFQRHFCAFPHPCTLYVHPNKVDFGV